MDVSENSGTLKSSHFNRAFHYKPSILGGFPLIFGNTHITLVREFLVRRIVSHSPPFRVIQAILPFRRFATGRCCWSKMHRTRQGTFHRSETEFDGTRSMTD